MAKRAKPIDAAGERFLSKGDEFLLLTQTAVQAAMMSLQLMEEMPPCDRLVRTQLLATVLSDAVTVTSRIPAGMSALAAAHDFIAYAIDSGPHWDDPPERPVPARWMGLAEQEDVQALFSPIQIEIDGRWQSENPEWDGLPYDDSAHLRLLVCIRSVRRAMLPELVAAVPWFTGGADGVVDLLGDLDRDGWIETAAGPSWTATERLTATTPKRPAWMSDAKEEEEAERLVASIVTTDAPEVWAKPKRDLPAERLRDRDARMARLPDKPDARALPVELRRRKQLATRELRPLVPHLDRNATVRLLKLLRDAGWLEVVGTTKNAEWRATDKLLTMDFRRRDALAG